MLSVQGATSGQQVPGVLCHISTHAPRAGSDVHGRLSHEDYKFQSTLPVRGATALVQAGRLTQAISIHASRAGSDSEDAQNGTVYFEQLS